MRKTLFLTSLLLMIFAAQAQVGIVDGDTTTNDASQSFETTPVDAGAVLELRSDSKAFLLPRLTTSAIDAITPVEGMLVYDKDGSCFKAYDGTAWQVLGNPCVMPVLPTVQFNVATISFDEADEIGAIDINYDNQSGSAVDVSVSTSATPLSLTTEGSPISIPTGTGTYNYTFGWTDNMTDDGDATFTLTLDADPAYTVNSPGSADVTITEDDGAASGFVQNFDTGSNWNYTLSTPLCTNGSDVWDIVSSPWNGITMESDFFGLQDLDGNCGSAAGETITFDTVSITTETTISFDYDIFEFDNGDDVKYTVILDGVNQPEVVLMDGNNNASLAGTEQISIPSGTTSVGLILFVDQNGGGDWAGFDNFKVQ